MSKTVWPLRPMGLPISASLMLGLQACALTFGAGGGTLSPVRISVKTGKQPPAWPRLFLLSRQYSGSHLRSNAVCGISSGLFKESQEPVAPHSPSHSFLQRLTFTSPTIHMEIDR